MILQGNRIQLLPFESKYWSNIAKYFYSEDYKNFFRQFPRMLTEEDFKDYARVVGGEVHLIHSLMDNQVVGMIQIIPDGKKNKGCFLGIIVDKAYQKQHLPMEALLIILDHLFNRQGYNKVIVEILETDTSTRKSLEKTGWYKEGKLLQECFMDGKYHNELRYSMSAYYFNKFKDKFTQELKVWVDSLKI